MEDGPPPSLRIEEAHLTLQRELSQREPTLLPLLRDLMRKIDIDRRELTEKQGKLAQQRPNSPLKGKRP